MSTPQYQIQVSFALVLQFLFIIPLCNLGSLLLHEKAF